MQDAKQGAASAAALQGQGLRIGIVQARFNADVTETLWQSCHAELLKLGVAEQDIEHHTVPGALEVPLLLQALADRDHFDALEGYI